MNDKSKDTLSNFILTRKWQIVDLLEVIIGDDTLNQDDIIIVQDIILSVLKSIVMARRLYVSGLHEPRCDTMLRTPLGLEGSFEK